MKKIIFFLPTYPDVMYSFLLSFAKKSKADITIVCLKNLLAERQGLFNENELSEYVEFIYRNDDEPFEQFISSIITENINAIFVFGGFLGDVGRALQIYNNKLGKNGIIITEKPSMTPVKRFNWFIRILKTIRTRLIYGKAYRKVADSIKAVLVTGKKGVSLLKSCGIPEEKLYNFMYTHIDEILTKNSSVTEDRIKFVYVGRFNYLNRGIDNLIYTFDKLNQKNWSLDLVGGYGENADEIIEWANKKENVSYVGAWKSNEVINNLQNYDICVSPTRIDGWRIQVNQAIIAGIGTITTEEAISDELVKESKSGLVVNAFNHKGLFNAVSYVLDHPSVVNEWKNNALKYRDRISNDKIADYFNDVIEFTVLKTNNKPRSPWL